MFLIPSPYPLPEGEGEKTLPVPDGQGRWKMYPKFQICLARASFLAWFAANPVAANLLMAIIFLWAVS